MSTDVILFLLRLISGFILVTILMVLFIVMWRGYRRTVTDMAADRRVYGKLIVMRNIEGTDVVTGEVYPLLPLTSLGRSPTNTIRINDSFASGEHALLAMRNGQWWLEDRKSRNGTLLNNMPVTQPMVITEGDIIGIGQLKFVVELEN